MIINSGWCEFERAEVTYSGKDKPGRKMTIRLDRVIGFAEEVEGSKTVTTVTLTNGIKIDLFIPYSDFRTVMEAYQKKGNSNGTE